MWTGVSILDGISYLAGRQLSLTKGWIGFDQIVSIVVSMFANTPLEVGFVIYLPVAWITVCGVMYHSILNACAPLRLEDAPRNQGPD